MGGNEGVVPVGVVGLLEKPEPPERERQKERYNGRGDGGEKRQMHSFY